MSACRRDMGRLCLPYSGEDLHWFPVDPKMSNSKNDGPECCKPLKRKAITAFFKPRTGLKPPTEQAAEGTVVDA